MTNNIISMSFRRRRRVKLLNRKYTLHSYILKYNDNALIYTREYDIL